MKNIIFETETEAKPETQKNTGFIYDTITNTYKRNLTDTINRNLALLDSKIRHTDITQTLEDLETEIRADLDEKYEYPEKLETLWRDQFLRKERPYNYRFYSSIFLTIIAKIMQENGDTEKAWSFIAAAFHFTGSFELEEIIESRIEHSNQGLKTASCGGKASASRYDGTKAKAKELLIEKMKTNTVETALQAARLIEKDLKTFKWVTLTKTNITKTLKKWISTDKNFKEFGLK